MKPPVLSIVWEDVTYIADTYNQFDPMQHKVMKCDVVGHYIKKTDDLILISSMRFDDNDRKHIIKVPRRAIVLIECLRRGSCE